MEEELMTLDEFKEDAYEVTTHDMKEYIVEIKREIDIHRNKVNDLGILLNQAINELKEM